MALSMSAKRKCLFEYLMTTIFITILFLSCVSCGKKSDDNDADKRKKKSLMDYNDADLERLYEQWEESDEDKLEPDELPEWKRELPPLDLENLNNASPDLLLQASKKGRTLMMFATVAGNPTEKETEQITQRWHTDLFNANYELQRYVVGTDRVLFQLKDGSKAWQIKDYLVQQENCQVVTIENQDYPGAGSQKQDSAKENKKDKSSDTKTKSAESRKKPKSEL